MTSELRAAKKSLLEIDGDRDEIQNLLDEKTNQNVVLIKKNQDFEVEVKMLSQFRNEAQSCESNLGKLDAGQLRMQQLEEQLSSL